MELFKHKFYPLLWHSKGCFSYYENNVLLNIVLTSHEENFYPLTEIDIQIHTVKMQSISHHGVPSPSWNIYKINSIHKVLRKSHKRSWIKVRTTASECFLWFSFYKGQKYCTHEISAVSIIEQDLKNNTTTNWQVKANEWNIHQGLYLQDLSVING